MSVPLETGRAAVSGQLGDRAATDRRLLALDALSKLTRQFADTPDLERLIEVLVLTLNGQFSVSSAVAVLRHPEHQAERALIVSTGSFREHPVIAALGARLEEIGPHLAGRAASRVDGLSGSATAAWAHTLHEAGVRVVAGLQHEGKVVGLIGLGEKVSHKPFSDAELELLDALCSTATPLIVNSFLFLEIANLNTWYLQVLDSVKQGVFVFDPQARLKKVNAAGFELLCAFRPELSDPAALYGLSPEQLFPEASFPGWARQMAVCHQPAHRRPLENLSARDAHQERVYTVRLSDVASGAESGCDQIVTLDDVTAQKESEHRLFDLEKFAEKGMMASSISHELNNFLALILGGVELAQMVMNMGSVERAQRSLEKIKIAVKRMERFTAGLMDYTRLGAQKKIQDLNAIVTDVLSFVAVQKRFVRVRIDSDLDPALPPFEFDSDQMAQLLLNLLNNAADAIVETDRDDGQIEVRTRREGLHAVLAVKDNGAGIKPEVQSKLFNVHLTTKEKGHGYGLVTCARIIAGHGGMHEIQSEPGEGTTIRLCFPTTAPVADAGAKGDAAGGAV